MFLAFTVNELDFKFKVSYIYSWSRFSTYGPVAVLSGVRMWHKEQ